MLSAFEVRLDVVSYLRAQRRRLFKAPPRLAYLTMIAQLMMSLITDRRVLAQAQ